MGKVITGDHPVLYKFPLYGGAADIADGAVIMPGTSAGTNLGLFVVGSGACADALGILRGLHDYSAVGDSNVDGSSWVFGQVELFDQYKVVEMEYDQSDTAAVASNSGTTLTVTSLEDNIDTSWIFNVTKNGSAANLSFLTASASGSATQKTAMGWEANDTVIKILRLGHQLAKINTAADKIGTDAGAGSWTVCILENSFEADGWPRTILNPTIHDNLTLTNPRFYAKLLVRNTAGHTTE